MIKILVADRIAEEGLATLREADGVQTDVKTGLTPAQLGTMVGDYDGLLIRSGVQVTAEALENPGRLRAIARAGVGVDNVDLDAATAAGVLVMNTPDANTVATAEQAIALMFAAFRHIPDACQHVRSGGWERKNYVGHQLAGKTLGVVGLGRVGRAVARRALGLEMKVLGHDPFLSGESTLEGRVPMIRNLDDLLPQVDCLTLHAVLTEQTRNLIDRARLARMKKSAVLINCARGGLVDEAALAEALNLGELAAAAVDVFAQEPPTGSPLLTCRNIVLTPHLGASTEEAQTAVSTEAVDALLDYLRLGTIRNAVNVADLPADLSERDRAWLDLAARLGTILAPMAEGGIDRLTVTTCGAEGLTGLGRTLALSAFTAVMAPHVDGRLNMVNADAAARQRNIDLQHVARSAPGDYPESLIVRIERDHRTHQAEGAVFHDRRPRVLAIDGYRMEMLPEGRLVALFNDDRPGVIGWVGTRFGERGINIADMTLSRRDRTALMVLRIDAPLPVELMEELRNWPAILSVRTVTLPPLNLNRTTS